MSTPPAALWQAVGDWLERGAAAAWLPPEAPVSLRSLEREGPAALFEPGALRPLVVAFFGGTGVGKSSLLNRLAGAPVARTGVERPTSREVTVHAYASLPLARLEAHFPAAATRLVPHHDAARRDVLWVDMPDIDSTAAANRRLAFAWLPCVDLLVYVVSPERYRDEAGWRVLRERGHRHGWLFVINRWDEGAAGQFEDFTATLRAAGFDDPLVMRSCCTPAPCQGDDFPRLEALVRDLQARQLQQELERLGELARLGDLAGLVARWRASLGDDADFAALADGLRAQWRAAGAAILEGSAWGIAQRAAAYAARAEPGLAALLPAGARGDAGASADPSADGLWDPWAEARLRRVVDAAEVEARRGGIAAAPLVEPLRELIAAARQAVPGRIADGLRAALARPGGALGRLARSLTGAARRLLPLAALAWVGAQVLRGYHAGVAGEAAFLGADFAIHSVLLVAVAWLLPHWLHRALRPAPQRIAAAGLRAGLADALAELEAATDEGLAQAAANRAALAAEAERLLAALAAARRHEAPRSPDLARLLRRGAGDEG